MKILVPYFEITGKASYPDDYSRFTNAQRLTFAGDDYWQFDYTGIEQLETGNHTYMSMLAAQTVTIYPLANVAVVDALSTEIPLMYGAYQHSPLFQLTITADIVDENEALQTQCQTTPLKVVAIRESGGQPTNDEQLFDCDITAGVMTITGQFERSGTWRIPVAHNSKALKTLGYNFGVSHADLLFWV